MYCRDMMLDEPSVIDRDTALSDAVELMIGKHMQSIIVVRDDMRFRGELTATQLAKILLPHDPNYVPQFGSAAHEHAAQSIGLSQLQDRLRPYLGRPVADFMDRNVPTVRPETPLEDALVLLRGGVLRLPVVEGPQDKLVGAMSILTIMRAFDGT